MEGLGINKDDYMILKDRGEKVKKKKRDPVKFTSIGQNGRREGSRDTDRRRYENRKIVNSGADKKSGGCSDSEVIKK